VAVKRQALGKRIGVAEGEFTVPDDIDGDNAAIADMFAGQTR
jgi:hypothetical protein